MEVGTTQPRLAAILALGGTRWAGVPFGRRPGTALEADSAEIATRFTAYAHPIQETVKGGPMLFIRGDEAEEAWPDRPHDRVIEAWSPGGRPVAGRCRGRTAPGHPALTAGP